MKIRNGWAHRNKAVLEAWDAYSLECLVRGFDDEIADAETYMRYSAIIVDGQVRSVMFFIRSPVIGAVRIRGAWTDPAFRRQGLYESIFYHVAEVHRRLGFKTINGGYHHTNLASRTMQKKRGGAHISSAFTEGHVNTYYDLQRQSALRAA